MLIAPCVRLAQADFLAHQPARVEGLHRDQKKLTDWKVCSPLEASTSGSEAEAGQGVAYAMCGRPSVGKGPMSLCTVLIGAAMCPVVVRA